MTDASTPIFAAKAELSPPDAGFLERVGAWGLGQGNWDSDQMAGASFPHAYRFTRSYRIERGDAAVLPLPPAARQLALSEMMVEAEDGPMALDMLLRDRLRNHALVVLRDGRLFHEHFWNGMTPTSTHIGMSMTKSFVAILVGIATDEGLLDMDKAVTDYMPEFVGTAFDGMKIQHVADMRTSLAIETTPPLSWDPKFTKAQEWNGPNDSGLAGVAAYLRTIAGTDHPAGAVYCYQDPNTEILGLLVERVTGSNLADYLQERIWSRFGAEHDAHWMADPTGFVVASGGLNIATRDLARFGTVMVNGGAAQDGTRIVPAGFIDAVMDGNDEVRAAWTRNDEAGLVVDGWYKDQIRTLNLAGRKVMVFAGIHGQVLIMEPATKSVIAFNGGYPFQTSLRMAMLIFHQAVPALLNGLDALMDHAV